MENNTLIVLGGVAGAFIAIITALAFIFPTKEKVRDDCSECRAGLYKEIKALSDRLNNKADTSALQVLTLQYQEILTSITKLTTTVEMMLKQEEHK